MDYRDDNEPRATCPNCKQPDVVPGNVWDGKRFYRCHRCAWSWFTVAIRRTEGEAT